VEIHLQVLYRCSIGSLNVGFPAENNDLGDKAPVDEFPPARVLWIYGFGFYHLSELIWVQPKVLKSTKFSALV
jgi:hypothetical protein